MSGQFSFIPFGQLNNPAALWIGFVEFGSNEVGQPNVIPQQKYRVVVPPILSCR